AQAPWAHPGRCAEVFRVDGGQDARLGWVAELHPRLLQALEIDTGVVVFEADLEPLLARPLPRAGNRSKYPSVRRDLAFVVPQAVTWAQLAGCVRSAAGPTLRDLVL